MSNQVSGKYFKAKAKVSISHMDESDLYLISWSDDTFTTTNFEDGEAYTREYWNSYGITEKDVEFIEINEPKPKPSHGINKIAHRLVQFKPVFKDEDIESIEKFIEETLSHNINNIEVELRRSAEEDLGRIISKFA